MSEEAEAQALEAQAEAVLDTVRATVIRLLLDGGVRPQLVALGVARVAGELGASIAVADGLEFDRVLDELADFTHRAGREHHELVRLEDVPTEQCPLAHPKDVRHVREEEPRAVPRRKR
jgi:hypothetical protein